MSNGQREHHHSSYSSQPSSWSSFQATMPINISSSSMSSSNMTSPSQIRPDGGDGLGNSCGRIESLMLDPLLTSSPSPSPPPLNCIDQSHNNTANMNANNQHDNHIVYRLALTGGPCSGKTTGQARISTFFENLGWKVYRVPETATTLFSGGIRFPDLSLEEQEKFQENLIKVMISIERTFFSLAQTCNRNCLVICDRGVMDATAYMSDELWQRFLRSNKWNTIDLRDNRYNQVIHLVTSADGAEEYYNMEGNPVRTEGLQLARELDRKTMEAWVGHPYMDVIDNSTDFDTKIRRLISALCRRIGIEAGDRLQDESRKLKFLVNGPPPQDSAFPQYQDFDVVHDYLITSNSKIQSRIRKRGQNGIWSYQQTVRRSDAGSQMVELRRQITHRDYVTLLAQRDDNHHTIYKTRRCFIWQQTYFQMDIYQAPRNGLILLEAYTTLSGEALKAKLPSFLNIVREVTEDPEYSMFELSKRLPPPPKPSGSKLKAGQPPQSTRSCSLSSLSLSPATTAALNKLDPLISSPEDDVQSTQQKLHKQDSSNGSNGNGPSEKKARTTTTTTTNTNLPSSNGDNTDNKPQIDSKTNATIVPDRTNMDNDDNNNNIKSNKSTTNISSTTKLSSTTNGHFK